MIDMLKYLQMNDAIKTQQNIHWRDDVADLFDAKKNGLSIIRYIKAANL